ncbi:MAG: hypothetical protein CME62_08235 [Halobacteriovoraceae bacterium]|nr:hypothetical protein [Halobacteriovoraceae bacterium]|tara:strand:+ start:19126 stop:19626 length:501 start_codon:yes stop_codon:yes gene_type:complete
MKKLFLTGLLLGAVSAYACPNLTGTYVQCESDLGDVSESLTITQAVVDGKMTYKTVDAEGMVEVLTVGERSILSDEMDDMDLDDVKINMVALPMCNGDVLNAEMAVELEKLPGSTMSDEEFNMLQEMMGQTMSGMSMSVSLDSAKNLVTEVKVDGDVLERSVCKRK